MNPRIIRYPIFASVKTYFHEFSMILQGENDFVVESLEASFRYPMDFTYHIQNFSAIPYHKTVKPDQEATVAYSFIPADAFAGRPIGLSVNLAYR